MRQYNARGVRLAVAVLWAALPTLAPAQDSSLRLDLNYAKQRPVDRVLAKVDANRDSWISERDYQEIDMELKQWGKALAADPRSLEALSGWTAGLAEVALAEFKITEIGRAGDGQDLVRAQLRAEVGGTDSEGYLRSVLGNMATLWTKEGSGWTLRGTERGKVRSLSADRRGFAEVTERAFGRDDAHARQLGLGTDHWRDSLDAALGVSVYGHQGISLGDFDGDGLEDLYVGQPAGLPNRLFRNNGDGTFSDVSRRAGLDVLDETSMSLFGDLDNDGDQDLVLVGAAPLLFRNDSAGRFELDRRAGLEVPEGRAAMLTGAALADYDLDGDLDLYVCAYDFWEAGSDYDAPTPYYDAVNGPANLLYRNDGSGVFEEVSAESGLDPGNDRFSFAAAWGDYDNDGDPDLYVANDFGRNNLYRNNGDGTFSDVAADLGVEDLGAGMSAAWGDYDNDGDLDLYTANMWSSAGLRITGSGQFGEAVPSEAVRGSFRRQAQGNSLFRNDGPAGFADVSDEAGVRTGRWAWASDFVDFDSDGWLDLFVQNGYITGERMDDL